MPPPIAKLTTILINFYGKLISIKKRHGALSSVKKKGCSGTFLDTALARRWGHKTWSSMWPGLNLNHSFGEELKSPIFF